MSTKIQQFSELSKFLSDKNSVSADFLHFLEAFRIGRSLQSLKMEKKKGQSSLALLRSLLIFRLCGVSIYESYRQRFGGIIEGGKNQFYRFLERPRMNWRQLLVSTAKAFVRLVAQKGEQTSWLYAILDDTTLEKTGHSIEGITKVFDHTTHSFVLGFKLLMLAIGDEKTTIPFDFSLHAETHKDGKGGLTDKQRRNRRSVKRADDDCAKTRKSELKIKKTDAALQMLRRMCKHGILPKYLLMDKWFCTYAFIAEVRKIARGAMQVITLLRDKRTRFIINGKTKSADMLCKEHDHNMRVCRQYNCRYYKVLATLNGMNVALFLVKYGRSGYEVILTTDTDLRFKQAFEHYQHRWSIEVMFKECKQYLDLGTCQSTNLNSQIADCTLVFIGYNIIALKKRFSDYEVFGELYREMQREFYQLTLIERLLPIIADILDFALSFCDTTLSELMQRIVEDDQTQQRVAGFLKTINMSKSA